MKTLLFRIHWLLGLVGGAVLAIVGITGAMLSFEAEIIAALNPGIVTAARRAGDRLSPPDLLAAVARGNPERRITSIEIDFSGARTPRVGFARPQNDATGAPPGRRIEWRNVDPYSAQLLDAPAGEAFFRATRDLHRYLAAGDAGKQIVGASTAALLLLVASGIYLRWPRNARRLRTWLHIDRHLRGRAFLYRLHAVVGTVIAPVYLAVALTGLTWSYEWYRNAFFSALGAAPAPRPTAPMSAPAANDAQRLDPATTLRSIWPALAAISNESSTAMVMLPDMQGKAVDVRYFDKDAPHERASNRLVIDPASARPTLQERYADKPLGARIAAGIFPLHRGSYFGVVGVIVAMVASLLMPVFAVTGLMMYVQRKRTSATSAERRYLRRRQTRQSRPPGTRGPTAGTWS